MKVIVLGASGQLGWQCLRDLPRFGFEVIGLNRDTLDVSVGVERDWRNVVSDQLRAFNPQWVINTLAYTAVDRAEDEPQTAIQVNASFAQVLATSIRQFSPQTRLLQCSTDYVFDGLSDKPYRENEQTRPLSVYGQSKLLGEQAVLSLHEGSFVLRFSWVVGEHGQNFAKTILRLASERGQIRVVGDQHGVPSPTPFLVQEFSRLMHLYSKVKSNDEIGNQRIFHVVPSGETNWHAYAQWCIEIASSDASWAKRLKLRRQDILCIETSQYPTKATRPLNSTLDCSAWCKLHNLNNLPAWDRVTRPVIASILENQS